MRRAGQRRRLLLALVLSLFPVAILIAGLVGLSQAWLRSQPESPAEAAESVSPWVEWERGLATWYEGPTDTMRNGEKLDLNGMTCAVDAADWPDMKGKTLRVRRQGQPDDAGVLLRVTDSGYLRSAGRFLWNPLGRRYVRSPFQGHGLYVVVDIPRETHRRLFGGNTVAVIVEVEGGQQWN